MIRTWIRRLLLAVIALIGVGLLVVAASIAWFDHNSGQPPTDHLGGFHQVSSYSQISTVGGYHTDDPAHFAALCGVVGVTLLLAVVAAVVVARSRKHSPLAS